MKELVHYTVVVANSTELYAATNSLIKEVRRLLSEEWVPFEGFSHVAVPNGRGEYIHILTQPMVK